MAKKEKKEEVKEGHGDEPEELDEKKEDLAAKEKEATDRLEAANKKRKEIEEANENAEKLEKANAEAEKALGGETEAGAKPPEETPEQYKDRVMAGKAGDGEEGKETP